MEVILLESIEGLGRKGALVTVKNGFGRNYLLPRKKAMVASKDMMYRLESLKKRFALEESKLLSELKIVAELIQAVDLRLVLRATREGHLYGSVTPLMIAGLLRDAQIKIEDRQVRLAEPIKAVGTYVATIRLHPDLHIDVQVHVDPEGGYPDEEGEQDGEGEAEGDAAAEGADAEASADGAGEATASSEEAPAE